MQPERIHDTIRQLEGMSDAQIAALTFPREGLRIQTPAVIQTRYMGGSQLPPGPPHGIYRRDDGRYSLTKVAIVRIQPDTHIAMARKLQKRGVKQIVVAGIICGLIVPPLAVAGMIWWQKRQSQQVDIATPPCVVASISPQGVACRTGNKDTIVPLGSFFPDGRYALAAVDPGQNGFKATRKSDQQTVVFHADPTSLNPAVRR